MSDPSATLITQFTNVQTAIDALKTSVLGPATPSLPAAPGPVPTPAPPAPPALPATPRVQIDQLRYACSWRLPREASNGQLFDFSGGPITLNFRRPSPALFVGNRAGYVAELAIPTDPAVEFCTYLQGFCEPSEGKLASAIPGPGLTLGGLLAIDDDLIVTGFLYYDADNTQRVSHVVRSVNLATTIRDVRGPSAVWNPQGEGDVAGYLARVPLEWQAVLGGSVLTGQFGIPIVGRTSEGPAAFAIDPHAIGAPFVPAIPLVYYPGDHPALGPWEGANATYGGTASGGGLVCVDGSALFFGRNGLGTFSYGNGTSDPTLAGTIGPDGEGYVYDPANAAKGQHAYPYRYEIWAYALADFAAVAAGTKQPWEVLPYGVWPLTFPTPDPAFTGIGGADYDPTTRTLYLSQLRADVDGYGYRAYIHAFTIAPPM